MPVSEAKEDSLYRLHNTDARRLLEIVPSNTVDVIITSPPYFNLKDYGTANQIGYGQSPSDYMKDLEKVLTDCYEVTRDSGSLWLVMDTYVQDGTVRLLPFEVAQRLEETKSWKLSDIIIWDKQKTLPWSRKGQFRAVFEYVLFFRKSSRLKFRVDRVREPVVTDWWVKFPERYNPRGKVPTSIWHYPIPTQGTWGNGFVRHFCPFPPELVERILLLTTDKGDVVFDPFAGSGSVLATAHCMGRRYIGIEINSRYVERFGSTVLPNFLREWKERKSSLSLQRPQSESLFRKIGALRQLKLASQLIRQLKHNNASLTDGTIIAAFLAVDLRRPLRKRVQTFEPEITMVLNDHSSAVRVKEVAQEALAKAPFTLFNVVPLLEVMSWADFLKSEQGSRFTKKQLWLYAGSMFYNSKGPLSFEDWTVAVRNGNWAKEWKTKAPPVLSDVGVRLLASRRDIELETVRSKQHTLGHL